MKERRTIPFKEDLKIEFKSDRKLLPDLELIEAIVGMTNTEGGQLFLGVEDDGEITGVHEKHMDEVGLSALVANKTVPSLSVKSELMEEEGRLIMNISVPKSRTIIATSDGKMIRRRLKIDGTPENTPMYPYEINTRLSELNRLDFSAMPLKEASLEDLDAKERERLRALIQLRKGDETLIGLSDEELDKALRLIREEDGVLYPTITGMILIGKEERLKELMPTWKTSFQVLEGTAIRVNEQYHKPLLAVFEIIEQYLKAWNPEREIDFGLLRLPIPEFSKAAIREGLVNAFCHRDYSVLQMVRIQIDDDGLSISNPGGFIEGVNLQNLLTVEPHGRNPALAEALKRIGLAEITGRGIDRIYEGAIVFGRPIPDYSESNERMVKLFLQRAEPDIAFIKMLRDEENRSSKPLGIQSLLILWALKEERRLGVKELIGKIPITEQRLKVNIEKLLERGLVEAKGNGKSRDYILSAKVYKREENIVGYVRQSGIDNIRFRELVMKFAETGGSVTRKNVSELLRVNENEAYRILKRLTIEGELVLVGSGRSAKYVKTK